MNGRGMGDSAAFPLSDIIVVLKRNEESECIKWMCSDSSLAFRMTGLPGFGGSLLHYLIVSTSRFLRST